MAAPPPPALMDELVEGCLLRLPPDDLASLVRAALVCKRWRCIVADCGFRRRFCELHRRPPMLGFFHVHTRYGSSFTPVSFRPRNTDAYLRLGGWHAIDSRHGRILLSSSPSLYGSLHTHRRSNLAVWDPISGDQLDLPELPLPQHPGWFSFTSKAAVLCASSSSSCDHLDCHRGHFVVIMMDATYHWVGDVAGIVVDVYVYSSQVGAWSHLTSAAQDGITLRFLPRQAVTMAGNALYFRVHKSASNGNGILKYDMGTHPVDLPPDCSSRNCRILLTTMEHGGLGIVRVEKNTMLHLWSWEAGPRVLGWEPSGVIELETLLPANSGPISMVHGLGALFIMTNAGGFTVDLLSNRVRKVCGNSCVNYFVPYTSFCTPAFTGEEPAAGVPSA